MRGRTVPVQLAHMPGSCGAALSTNGNHLLTTGTDATLRPHDISDTPTSWWRADAPEPDLPELAADLHEKPVPCLALSPNNLTAATGCEDGHVRIFSIDEKFEKATFLQACARFGGPVRAIAFSPTGSFLAAAGDEPGVLKIIMTAQPSNVNILRASGADGQQAVVGMAYDPRGDFVACVGEKGEAVIWDVEKCKFVCLVQLNKRKANCVTWDKDGESLVYGTDKGVVIVSRGNWLFDCLLEDAGDQDDDDDEIFAAASGKDNVSAVAVSPNGRYLLAGREDSNISVWDLHQKKVLGGWRSEEVAQKLLWHPTSNAFMLVDKIGQWGIVGDVMPSHMPAPQSDSIGVELPALPETDDKPKKRSKSTVDEDDDERIVRRSRGASRRKKQMEKKKKASASKAKQKSKKEAQASEAEEDDQELENGFEFNASDVEADEEEKLRHERDDDDSEASGDSDEDSESDEELDGELADLENGGVRLPQRKRKNRRSRGKGNMRGLHPAALVQKPFMPSSTPLSEKVQRKKHILCWNLVGAVLSYGEDTHDIIEIEFEEASKRTVGVKDHFGYTMGCLSETGVFLASPKKKEHGSLITFRPFSSWANSSDWTQFLQSDENISSIALGQRFAAVSTTPNNVIRMFSLSGIQTSVFGVPGTVITTAAKGDNLAVVFVEAGSAALKCELLEISSTGDVEKIVYSGSLMTCSNASLEWVGFTNDTNELCSYDSKGWLWLMADPKNSRRWIPMMQNAAKTAECDWFWVASATANHVVGVPCLSNERYPQAKPRPALRSIPLSAPVIENATKNGKPTVVERLARTKLNLQRALVAKAYAEEVYDSDDDEFADAEEKVSRMELETDKCLLALMEDACKREQNMRALDLATRLHCKVSFKYATELAKHYKRTALASRVEQVAMKKLMIIEDEEQTRTRKAVKSRSSPVTPVSAARPALRSDSVMTHRKPTIPKMDFGSDDDDEVEAKPEQPEPITTSTKGQRVTGKAKKINHTTDDEEDGEKTEPESKPESPERNSGVVKREPETTRKRSAPLPASQASVGGFVSANRNATKKPRIADNLQGKAKKKMPFLNRFAKK